MASSYYSAYSGAMRSRKLLPELKWFLVLEELWTRVFSRIDGRLTRSELFCTSWCTMRGASEERCLFGGASNELRLKIGFFEPEG